MIHFHMSVAKPQLHKQCITVSIKFIQKGLILSTFPFCYPLTSIALWTNNQWKQTIFLLIFKPHSHLQNCLRCCRESPFCLQKTFIIGSFHDLSPKYCTHTFQFSSTGSQVNLDIGLLSIIQILQKEFTFWGYGSKTQFDRSFAITLTSLCKQNLNKLFLTCKDQPTIILYIKNIHSCSPI